MKIKTLAAFILIASTAIAAFTACNSDETEPTTSTQPQSTIIHATDYTYNILSTKPENKTEYVHTVPPLPTEKEENKADAPLTDSVSSNEETTKKKPTGGNVNEESNGLSLTAKTSPVSVGNTATVIIQGAPDKRYTIEFYKSETETASYSGLSEIASDSAGFASWTFEIGNDCEPGNRKIIIKEKNTNKFIQTSITVQ